jgi:hypothetical protein
MNQDNNLPRRIYPLVGDSHADNERHLIARTAFMNRLLHTQRCEELFLLWRQMAGLQELGERLRAAIIESATYQESGDNDAAKQMSLEAIVEKEAEQITTVLGRVDIDLISDAAKNYCTTELNLRWAWLPREIVRAWIYDIGGWAFLSGLEINYYYLYVEPELPTKDFHFKALPGESHKERTARLRAETSRYVKEQKAQHEKSYLRGGWRSNPETIERYVEWFFRREVIGESVRDIVDFDVDGNRVEKPEDERYVRRCITEARRWLSLAP